MSESESIAVLRGPVPLAHLFLRSFVREGNTAVDATCGNGHDTLLLARLVGGGGHVYGFDIQEQAVAATARRLVDAGLTGRTTLFLAGHERLAEHVSGPVQTVLFNLGYLPGGDRSIMTLPETTVAALEQSLQILAPGGVILITVYPGHNGGIGEQSTVENWCASLDQRAVHCWRMAQTNVTADAPYLLLIQKVI